jgi:hypothetical protein
MPDKQNHQYRYLSRTGIICCHTTEIKRSVFGLKSRASPPINIISLSGTAVFRPGPKLSGMAQFSRKSFKGNNYEVEF